LDGNFDKEEIENWYVDTILANDETLSKTDINKLEIKKRVDNLLSKTKSRKFITLNVSF
jgi:hypothetical protein